MTVTVYLFFFSLTCNYLWFHTIFPLSADCFLVKRSGAVCSQTAQERHLLDNSDTIILTV